MDELGNLLAGYRRFRETRYEAEKSRWRALAEGQSPRAIVIACCDSRADPATIFDTDPGEIFVVRNVANLVPPFEGGGGRHGVSAALEFAVTQLGVGEIVVMGHERCGAVSAAVDVITKNAQFPGSIGNMLEPILPAVVQAQAKLRPGADLVDASVRANVARVAGRLRASCQPRPAGRLRVSAHRPGRAPR